MRGDQQDFVARLRLALPGRWFGDTAPVLDGVLAGLSALWVGLFDLIDLVRTQSRVRSASGDFLDLSAMDFFGTDLFRRAGEDDASFRQRLLLAMRRERGTRAALIDAAAQAGYTVRVFEAANPADTGAYNVASSLAWGLSGGWASLQMPFEALVVARPTAAPFPGELLGALAETMPAGGAAWVRIES